MNGSEVLQGQQEVAEMPMNSSGLPIDECFHCSDNPDKFSPLPKEQQPYCSKCFDALFVFDVRKEENNNGENNIVKTKPPPVPPKPKGKPPILYSTLPQPFQRLDLENRPTTPTITPPTPPLPSPPPPLLSHSPELSVQSEEDVPLPPPPQSPSPELKTSNVDQIYNTGRVAYSPIPPVSTSPVVTSSASSPKLGHYKADYTSVRPKSPTSSQKTIVYSSNRTPMNYKTMAAIPHGGQTFKSSLERLNATGRSNGERSPSQTSPATERKSLQNSPAIERKPLRSYSPGIGGNTTQVHSYNIQTKPSSYYSSGAERKPVHNSSGVEQRTSPAIGRKGVQLSTDVAPISKPVVPSVEIVRPPPVDTSQQLSNDGEESHLDQLNSIFKSASVGPRRNDTTGMNKPPTAAKPKFFCSKCDCNLLGKTVESQDSKLFCTPCYRIVISNRQCVTCGGDQDPENELITYKGEGYHVKCFCCAKCKLPIGKKTFCSQKDGIFCSDCYFASSGRTCVKCKKYLKSTGFLFRNEPWHHECFVCTSCQTNLGDREIFCKDENPFCSDCYDNQYVEKCAKCSKVLSGETVEYESQQYHDHCFCCHKCSKPIGSASFFPREGSIYCESCYTVKFGKVCKKCQQIISPSTGFGLVFKEEHYHRDCFVCSSCTKSLVNIPVHSSKGEGNNRPYCGDCYDDLYSKRCTACNNVISGVIGSKFMAFHDRYWHVECFNCKVCQTSLENRKFVPVQGEMHCIACSKFGPVS